MVRFHYPLPICDKQKLSDLLQRRRTTAAMRPKADYRMSRSKSGIADAKFEAIAGAGLPRKQYKVSVWGRTIRAQKFRNKSGLIPDANCKGSRDGMNRNENYNPLIYNHLPAGARKALIIKDLQSFLPYHKPIRLSR